MFQLTSQPLENFKLKDGFQNPAAGAFCSFEGWVRDHHDGKSVTALEYEAAENICHVEAEKILNEARQKFGVLEAKCFHRTGHLKIGEMAVWVGVSAPHREAAFAAGRYIIDEVKNRLPIWKKEKYTDGQTQWVQGP